MFTGLVQETGEIVKAEPDALWIRAAVLAGRGAGASVAVDGVCLTVADREGDVCRFELSSETLARSTLGSKSVGDRVNLERPLRAGEELGGHVVQGHVDGVGELISVEEDGTARRIVVRVPADLARYVVEKGSVTLDGVSLTAVDVTADTFAVALIPQTLSITTFGEARTGRRVNVEVDVLAKYVEKLRSPGEAS